VSAPLTIAKKLDRMIDDLTVLASAANRARDFNLALRTQTAIAAIGELRKGSGDDEWAEWKVWPPRVYPPGYEYRGLMDWSDVEGVSAFLREQRGARANEPSVSG